jgi:acyl-CoA synthetase (AMP-forming)/AMP-acid ligase II
VASGQLQHLKYIVTLPSQTPTKDKNAAHSYQDFLRGAETVARSQLQVAESKVKDDDVVNVQFTSGTTGLPKAALLTHRYVYVRFACY